VLPVRIEVTVSEELSSASVSLFSTISPEPLLTVKVSPSFTAPVSFVATGSSLTPVTVIVRRAVSVAVPSEMV